MKKKIIIIEDDNTIRNNIAFFLEEKEFEVYTAEDGFQGIELIKKILPDLIICDIMMPIINGYELHEMLQKHISTATIPFIFLTAKTQKFEIRKGMNMGVDDYISKPFTLDELLSSINSRLKKHSNQIIFNDENYRIMIENSLTGIFIIHNEKIIYANSLFLNIMELDSSFLKGCSMENIFKDKKIITKINDSIENNYKFISEYQFYNPKGEKKHLDIYGGPIKFKNLNSFIGIVIDNTKRKNFDNLLQENILMTEERERKHFAEELHDGLGPLMYSIKLYIETLRIKSKNIPEIYELTAQLDEMIISAIDTTKEIAFNLNPSILNDYGITNAIHNFIEKINISDSLKINFSSNFNEKRINKTCEINLYRIITELINNSIRHAEAKTLNINLNINNTFILLNYFDDGKGMDHNKLNNGFGLKNIEARVKSMEGTLEYLHTIAHGFNILISIDINRFKNVNSVV